METKKMSATVLENIKGSDLPVAWRKKMKAIPDERYTITIRPKKEERSLTEIMKDISREAKARGMTPEILEDILGEPIKHIL